MTDEQEHVPGQMDVDECIEEAEREERRREESSNPYPSGAARPDEPKRPLTAKEVVKLKTQGRLPE